MQNKVRWEMEKGKEKAHDKLYERLDIKEGEEDLYGLVRWRECST